MNVGLHGELALEDAVNIDTTIHEKNITYPTESKLAIKIINGWTSLPKHIDFSNSAPISSKVIRLSLRHFRHVKKRVKARKVLKRLRTISRSLIRELRKELLQHWLFVWLLSTRLLLYVRVLNQQPKDKNKIYPLHKPKVYCIAKNKDHNAKEYGSKASIAVRRPAKSLWALSAMNKVYMTVTSEILCSISRGKAAIQRVWPRLSRQKLRQRNSILPKKALKKDTPCQKDKKRNNAKDERLWKPLLAI